MKILVTGGAGFIGSNLVDELLKLDYEVLVIDNLLTGRLSNLSKNKLLKIEIGSIEHSLFLDEVFKSFEPDFLIHAAVSFNDPSNHIRDINTNILGTVNLIECSKKYNIKKIIYYQTSLCYGFNKSNNPMMPNTPYLSGSYKGTSSYAITKISAELFLEMSGIDFISFRLANVYGPRNFSGPIPAFYRNILSGKASTLINSSRDFIFINDVVSCTLKALNINISKGFFNISTGIQTSIQALYNLVIEEMLPLNHSKPQLFHSEIGTDDVETINIDSELTRKTFGWEPLTSLKRGIKQTIQWYNRNEFTNTFTHLKNLNN